MAIYLDVESTYKYERSIEALKVLKIFHDGGVDLKKVPNINSFDIYSDGYGFSVTEPIELVHCLTPHLFPSCEIYNYGIEERDGKLEVYDEFNFNEQLDSIIDPIDFVFFVVEGDFSKLDLEKVQRDGYFQYTNRHLLFSETALINFEKYSKPDFTDSNYVSSPDGFELYFYLNEDKTKFMVTYTEDCMAIQCDALAHVLTSVYKQTI